MDNTQTIIKRKVSDLKPGDVIMPPPREVSLWMRDTLKREGLPESDLLLTIVEVKKGRTDTRGDWTVIKAKHTEGWLRRYSNSDPMRNLFSFKARPDTLWLVAE